MIDFAMPALGADMDEGTLNEWLVKPGDMVKRGQVVAVVETTKAAVEIECWQEGIVDELLVPIGQTVQVGTPLARLRSAGESPSPAEAPTPAAVATPVVQPPAAPVAPVPPPIASAPAPSPPSTPAPAHRRWVSPAARRLALSLNVNVEALTGTGPQGAVVISDVEHAAAAGAARPAPAPVAAEAAAPAPTQQLSAKELAAKRGAEMRRSIAAAMSRSKHEIPHYYLAHDIALDNALSWLAERNAQRPITERVLPAVLQMKAVALAAQRFPEFSGFWRNDAFEPAPAVHVGVAISLRGGGLVAPAIHDVAGKKLDELMGDLTDLVARARAFSLRSSEMSDPSITVTNLGDQGVDEVFGVIYPPQVALVGFGKPAQRVCAVDGGIRIATTMHTTLAADHRASDGHRGALFLTAINDLLQQPDLLER